MISKEEIKNLAELARLQISDNEVTSLQKDISSILDYVGQLSGNNTGSGSADPDSLQDLRGRSPDAVSVGPIQNIMRADEPRGKDDVLAGKEEIVRAAFPTREGDYNVVRKIIQKDE